MEYYIALQDKEKEFVSIGIDNHYGVFWSDQGFDILNEIVNNKKHLVDSIIIKDEKNKQYSVLQFLEKLRGLKIR